MGQKYHALSESISALSMEDLQYLQSLVNSPDGQLPYPQDVRQQQRIRALRHAGYLSVAELAFLGYDKDFVRPTAMGRDAVAEWQRLLNAENEELERLREKAKKEAAQSAKQDASERRSARRSWWQFWLGLLLGWILGGFTPEEVFAWIRGLFH